ncbi:hypothetical protein EVG20_g11667 [Dentipellis fragilis]|uniref:F-box domain-containing protein n=1 Tax=Dentipellis fragilis TaxID=205917 RepID=A0A4Y9XKI9_9AGAM|nr:hypothetical protein EVG20_g11667 [Dentipellis fragilis]
MWSSAAHCSAPRRWTCFPPTPRAHGTYASCACASRRGSEPARGQLLGARRQVLLDGYRISAAVRRAAHNMEILRAFVWDGEELPPNDDMWFALRICCTRLKYIGTAFGSVLPSPKSHLFDFSDLHGFTLTFKKGFYWHHVGFTRNEPIPGYHRLWDMLIKRCPHLQELELDGDSPDDPADAQRLTRGRWPDLRKLVLGNVVLDWHTAVNPASKRPFITFLEEHCAIESLSLVGHQPSVAAPDLLSAVHPEALPALTEFYGSLQQIQALQNKKTLTSICVPDTIVLREGTPLSVSNVLSQIPSLTSLTLTFGLEHGYDNGSMLHALISACPQLQHLDLTYACKPSFSLVSATSASTAPPCDTYHSPGQLRTQPPQPLPPPQPAPPHRAKPFRRSPLHLRPPHRAHEPAPPQLHARVPRAQHDVPHARRAACRAGERVVRARRGPVRAAL